MHFDHDRGRVWTARRGQAEDMSCLLEGAAEKVFAGGTLDTGRGRFDTHAGIDSRETVSESIPETGAEAPRATRRAREMM